MLFLCKCSASPISSPSTEPVKSVDDFVPEDALDASFLEDTKDVKETKPAAASDDESDRFVDVNLYSSYNYHPPTKLREGNVFTSVCHSVGGRYITCIMA